MTVQEAAFALLTLTAMEVVLGIDNVIFIAVLAGRLPPDQQGPARRLGLAVALVTRLLLLFALSFLLRLQNVAVFRLSALGLPPGWLDPKVDVISWRDLVLIAGGLFLIGKSTFEIHHKLEGEEERPAGAGRASFGWVLVQIALLDVVFSLDSVITAVGMASDLWVMVAAMVIAVGVMLFFAGPVSNFVGRHPTLKVLALSFLILIGVVLVVDGFGYHIPKGYVYFAMAFSLAVEMINLRLRPRGEPVHLHERRMPAEPEVRGQKSEVR
jgi:predicted tellurium resistance membrane protein TerC